MGIPSDPLTQMHNRASLAAKEAAKMASVPVRDWVSAAIFEKLARDERIDALMDLCADIVGRKDATDAALIGLAGCVQKAVDAARQPPRRFGHPVQALPRA